MSFYYEQRGCCGSKKDHHKKEDHKRDERDCFCSKFIKNFIGQEVNIFLKGDNTTPVFGRIACFDKETGIVTVASLVDTTDVVLDYICCEHIARIQPGAPIVAPL